MRGGIHFNRALRVDQALLLHKSAERVYELAGLRTGSVRDQLVRSSLLVRGLLDAGIISPVAPLLVAGGGAAGINAALLAARHGVPVDVFERKQDAFATLRSCDWRLVDPHEYDWPHPHHVVDSFGLNTPDIALPFRAGTGLSLAQAWARLLANELPRLQDARGGHLLRVWPGTDMLNFNLGTAVTSTALLPVSGPWPGQPRPPKTTRNLGAVLSCMGSPEERTWPDGGSAGSGYNGPGFWAHEDGFGQGVQSPIPAASHVVISGGGDGGMQDLQRICTGLHGRALWQQVLRSAAAHLPGWPVLSADHQLAVMSADEVAHRALVWQRGQRPALQSVVDWHQAIASTVQASLQQAVQLHQQMASTPAAQATRRWGIDLLLDDVLRPHVRQGRVRVDWLHRGATPDFGFALNRVLCMLLLGLSEAAAARPQVHVHPQRELLRVTSGQAGHVCGAAPTCLGHVHSVETMSTAATGGPLTFPQVDLVLIRHGADAQTLLTAGASARQQMVPFRLPV